MIFHLLIAIAVAGLTWFVGWWGVAIVALLIGVAYHGEGGRPWRVALGAGEGWAILLLIDTLGALAGLASYELVAMTSRRRLHSERLRS